MSDRLASFVAAWRALLAHSGFRSGGLALNLLIVAAFAILVPWKRGIDFFDPIVVFAYSAIALLFAASAVTSLLAAGGPGPVPAVLGSALFGWSALLLIQLTGIVTVNLVYRAPRLLHPDYGLFAATLLFALAGALLSGAFSTMLSVVFSPAVARTALRLVFALFLAAGYFQGSYLPLDWQYAVNRQLNTAGLTRIALYATGVSIVLSAGLLYAFHRTGDRLPSN